MEFLYSECPDGVKIFIFERPNDMLISNSHNVPFAYSRNLSHIVQELNYQSWKTCDSSPEAIYETIKEEISEVFHR